MYNAKRLQEDRLAWGFSLSFEPGPRSNGRASGHEEAAGARLVDPAMIRETRPDPTTAVG